MINNPVGEFHLKVALIRVKEVCQCDVWHVFKLFLLRNYSSQQIKLIFKRNKTWIPSWTDKNSDSRNNFVWWFDKNKWKFLIDSKYKWIINSNGSGCTKRDKKRFIDLVWFISFIFLTLHCCQFTWTIFKLLFSIQRNHDFYHMLPPILPKKVSFKCMCQDKSTHTN